MIDEPKPEDKGVVAAVIERFEQWTLPRVLEIKAKVDRGEKLDDFDIGFLENALKGAQNIKSRVDKMPEYQALYTRALSLYEEITQKGLENERAGNGTGPTS
jgi:hypothetical protein